MTHLTDTEFVELIDLQLAADRVRHVQNCEVCQARADELRTALARVVEPDAPEPSPIFWEHFADRVRTAIQDETPESTGWRNWLRAPGFAWAATAAAVGALLLVATLWRSTPSLSTTAPTAPSVASAGSDEPIAGEMSDDIESDEAWALVRTVADDMAWDDARAAGIAVRPGTAERAVMGLTERERRELARLLEEELKRSGA
jgi:hypothetical protein